MKKRALLSVSDKTDVVSFARQLVALGFEIVSTGGTGKEISKVGLPYTLVELNKIAEDSIKTFGLVVVNLYPFAKDQSIANIDVGGPSMIRAAAKNYNSVGVVVYPADYEDVLDEIKGLGDLCEMTRFKLATKAFQVTAIYDTMIAREFDNHLRQGSRPKSGNKH
ncbi:MAG: hypothetical protein AAB917_01010 [Patescibacteria group bacterium]